MSYITCRLSKCGDLTTKVNKLVPQNEENISKLSLEVLKAQKKVVKDSLKAFKKEFTDKHNRAPTKADKYPMLSVYQEY